MQKKKQTEVLLHQVLESNLYPRLKRTDLSLIQGLTNIARNCSPEMLRGATPLIAKWLRKPKSAQILRTSTPAASGAFCHFLSKEGLTSFAYITESIPPEVIDMAYAASLDEQGARLLAAEGISGAVCLGWCLFTLGLLLLLVFFLSSEIVT